MQTGATTFYTTHYHAMVDRLDGSPSLRRLCCVLDRAATPPYTYSITPGVSRDSDGVFVAAQYGVSPAHLDALLAQKVKQGDITLRT